MISLSQPWKGRPPRWLMAEHAFSVSYDGPAIASGRIPVRDLAPALLALGDLFVDASVITQPRRKPVSLNIQATQEGSFIIQLVLEAESAWGSIEELFTSTGAVTLLNLWGFILGANGLFAFTSWVKNRKIVSRENVAAGHVRITLEDGESFEVPAEVVGFFLNETMRAKARQVVAPLTNQGIDRIDFRSESQPDVTIKTTDVPAFDVPEVEDIPLSEKETDTIAAIASVAFTEGNKWRLTDGEHTFYAAIEDEGFLERINDGIEVFRKGDMLRCRMRVVQTERADGLHTEYHVTEVIQHLPRTVQLRLSMDGSSPTAPQLSRSPRQLGQGGGPDESDGELGEDRQIGV